MSEHTWGHSSYDSPLIPPDNETQWKHTDANGTSTDLAMSSNYSMLSHSWANINTSSLITRRTIGDLPPMARTDSMQSNFTNQSEDMASWDYGITMATPSPISYPSLNMISETGFVDPSLLYSNPRHDRSLSGGGWNCIPNFPGYRHLALTSDYTQPPLANGSTCSVDPASDHDYSPRPQLLHSSEAADISDDSGPSDDEGRFACSTCGQNFATYYMLEDHAKFEKHRSYRCAECGNDYGRRDVYVRHIKTHRESSLHRCIICEDAQQWKRFARKDHLQQHIRTQHPFANPSAAIGKTPAARLSKSSPSTPSLSPASPALRLRKSLAKMRNMRNGSL